MVRRAAVRRRGARLAAYRGITRLGALTLASEVGDWRRFPRAATFTGFCGLVPSKYSSGTTTRRGHITKTGNGYLRAQQVEHSRSMGSDGRHSLSESPLYRPLLPVEDLRRLRPGEGVLLYGHLRPTPIRLRPFYMPGERRRRRRLEDRAERQLRRGEQRRERATWRAREHAERARTGQPSWTERLNRRLAGGVRPRAEREGAHDDR